MSKSKLSSAGPWAVFVVYLAIGLEVVIMISPFTAYFYAIYAPILHGLEAHRATAWLTAFFLPHISSGGSVLLAVLALLAPVLFGLGLLFFLVCAGQVYSAKLLRRGVVSRGLYARVRHPQYLGLAVAGLGLLLYWPRFIILVLYVIMLFLYHLLARDEERRMSARYGDAYRAYAESRPMFLPGSPGRRLLRRGPHAPPAGAALVSALFTLTLAGALGTAALLRTYSRSHLTTVCDANILAVALTGGTKATLQHRMDAVLADPDVSERLAAHPQSHALVAYVLPQNYMMQHLIADLGEHERHHGGGGPSGFLATLGHLGQMYALKPLRQLEQGGDSPRQRIIFTMAETSDGEPVTVSRALETDVLRYPLFFVDLDGQAVTMTMDTPPRNGWGTIPVPAF